MSGTSNAAHLIALLAAGEIAVQLWRAETVAAEAKHRYIKKIWSYEHKHGSLLSRIDPAKPEHAAIVKFTAADFAASQESQRKVYNLRRRLKAASCKAARIAASVA